MQELSSSEFDRVRPIFDRIENSRPIVYSVIEGNTPGRIFVDRPDPPATAVLRFSGGEIYIGGRADDGRLNREIVDLLFTELAPPRPKLLVFSFSETWKRALDELLKGHGVLRVVREMFELSPELFRGKHAAWRSRLPEGFRLERMNRQLALQSDSGLDFLWGGIDNFIAKAFGYCVLKEDEVVSRCSPVALGDKRFETGVGTVEAYRRRGLATVACCAFIEHCLDEGLAPEWGCYYNVASKSLALKLGFVSRPDVEVHYVELHE
jgi:RimJ/RimL family protein N-acetyltransferase